MKPCQHQHPQFLVGELVQGLAGPRLIYPMATPFRSILQPTATDFEISSVHCALDMLANRFQLKRLPAARA
jgi:hypothetical protein